MPASLYLLTTAPGLESEVQDSLLARPSVAASDVLFKRHVVARVRDDVDADELAGIDAVETVSAYRS